jgi:hypothetical protein
MHEVELWRHPEQERSKMAEYLVRFLDRAFFQCSTSGAVIEVTDTQFAFDPPSAAVKKQVRIHSCGRYLTARSSQNTYDQTLT